VKLIFASVNGMAFDLAVRGIGVPFMARQQSDKKG
jgi:hypothetical protein